MRYAFGGWNGRRKTKSLYLGYALGGGQFGLLVGVQLKKPSPVRAWFENR